MNVFLLFSGGKDSSLAGLILKKLGYNIIAVNVSFGVYPFYKYAKHVADLLGYEFMILEMNKELLEKIIETIIKTGKVSKALNLLHKLSIEEVIKRYDAKIIADGIRRDDKVPNLSISEIRSIEDRYNVEIVSPLKGLGYKTLRSLVNRYFIVEEDYSDRIKKSDYEAEIRYYMKLKGIDIYRYFPRNHKQSRVVGLKNQSRGGSSFFR